MTTLTNSEGKILNYTNQYIETILLQLNSSNNYYTNGDDNILFIKIGDTKVLLLDYTYHINRTIFQKYTINENLLNPFSLEFILNNTSNEYTLQGVYNANSYIRTITSLQQVFLAIYDTENSPYSYTGSENIDITNKQISLKFPIKVNDEIVFHPRNYDGAVFEMLSGTDMFVFRQNPIHGGTPIASFYSSTKECHFMGDCSIPNIYNKTSTDNLITQIYDDMYLKPEIDTLFSNIDLSNYYNKIEIDDLDNELSTLILNTYDKSEIDTFLTNYYNIGYLNTQFDLKANVLNTYTKSDVDDIINLLDIPSISNAINNLGSIITDVSNTRYTKTEVDGFISNSYNKTETDNLLATKVSNIGDVSLPGWLDIGTTYTNSRIRCNAEVGGYTGYAELRASNSYEMNLNLSTTKTDGAWMYFKINGDNYVQLSSSDNTVTIYKDTSIDGDLTAKNTTVVGDLTVTGNLIYNADSNVNTYTKAEIDDKLFLKVNESYGTIGSKLDVRGSLEASAENPLYVKNSTYHTNHWILGTFHQLMPNSGSMIQFSREGIIDKWQSGTDAYGKYVIRYADATSVVTVNQNGDTSIDGDLTVTGNLISDNTYTKTQIDSTLSKIYWLKHQIRGTSYNKFPKLRTAGGTCWNIDCTWSCILRVTLRLCIKHSFGGC